PGFEKLQVYAKHSTLGKGLRVKELFIAVKRTHKFHQSRIKLLLDTWILHVKEQVGKNANVTFLLFLLGAHVIFTHCSAKYSHPALSCKMATGFDAFLASGL
ncbi:hypothetical protein JRQ81_016295, partial [Phrynocephalus forsythii]